MSGDFKLLSLLILSCLEGTFPFCPRDGVSGSIPGSCFFAMASMGSASFGTGKSFCAEFYGTMATVTNVLDNAIVLKLAQKTFSTSTSLWLGANYDGQTVLWSDGSPDSFRNFQQPTPEPGDLYMDLATGQWLTAKGAATSMPFVCGMNDDSVTISTTTAGTLPPCPPSPPCPELYYYSSTLRNCYRGLYNITYNAAEAQCQQDGAHLASIHSLEENNLLVEMFQYGISTCDLSFYPMIGGHRTGPGKTDWEWMDGTPFDYTNWASNEPDNGQGNEDCVVIYADRDEDCSGDEGRWDDTSCDQVQRLQICKVPAKY